LAKLTIKSHLSNDFLRLRKKAWLHLVAAVAILLYGEGLLAVYVTGAARFSLLHLRHRYSLVFRGGKVELDMAISALIQTHVKFVAEFDVPRILQLEGYIFYGMTLYAFIGLKGVFAVMTGAAGLSFIHHGHGDRLFYSQIENLGVAAVAFTGAEMFLVTESYRSRFFHFDAYIRDFMTLDAILQIGGPLAVVASAAGLAFFHISHGVSVLTPEVENGVMAGLAVIFYTLLFEVLVVVEYDLAEIGYLECDIFDVDRIGERANEDRDDHYKKSGPLPHDCLRKI
jgi:hypothetical protein